jgi:hypothetical protein
MGDWHTRNFFLDGNIGIPIPIASNPKNQTIKEPGLTGQLN